MICMNKKVVQIVILLVLVIAMGLGAVFLVSDNKSESQINGRDEYAALKDVKSNHTSLAIEIGGKPLQVEVVNTTESITRGLSGREKVNNDGMLFVFASKRETTFWMPDMQFDLDILWIRDGIIVGITRDVPKPHSGQSYATLPRYPSPGEIEMVLELPAGSAEKHGIEIDDIVTFVAALQVL